MAVYLVTWDLNKEKPNYAEARKQFIVHLERYENIKDPGLGFGSFCLNKFERRTAFRRSTTKLDDNDRIIVTRLVSGSYYGWLHNTVWDWISARLGSVLI